MLFLYCYFAPRHISVHINLTVPGNDPDSELPELASYFSQYLVAYMLKNTPYIYGPMTNGVGFQAILPCPLIFRVCS